MLNYFYLWRRKNSWVAVFGLALALFCAAPMSVLAQPQELWTLEDSIRRVVEIAPETRGARAAVSARQGALQQAGAWPNPEIELRADDKMGKDEGTGGNDFTQFVFSQPLPLSGPGNTGGATLSQLATGNGPLAPGREAPATCG